MARWSGCACPIRSASTPRVDGRIDDPKPAGRAGALTTSGDRTPWLMEGGKGRTPMAVQFHCAPTAGKVTPKPLSGLRPEGRGLCRCSGGARRGAPWRSCGYAGAAHAAALRSPNGDPDAADDPSDNTRRRRATAPPTGPAARLPTRAASWRLRYSLSLRGKRHGPRSDRGSHTNALS